MSKGATLTYEQYAREVVRNSISLVGIRHEFYELLQELYEEGIYVYKLWFAVDGYPTKMMVALCYDDVDEFEVEAHWKYTRKISQPTESQYELDDIFVRESMNEWVW